MADGASNQGHPATLLCRPVVVAAVVVVAINDHILKGSGWLPASVTGKLSDVAGLFFFPILVAVLLYLGARALKWEMERGPKVVVDAAVVLTAVGFAAVNLVEPVNAVARQLWGVFIMDPTDLACLPMVLLARYYALKHWPVPGISPGEYRGVHERRPFRWPHAVAVAGAAAVSIATPAPNHVTTVVYPHWYVADANLECHQGVEIASWFGRTTKQGAGLVVRFDPPQGQSRSVGIEEAKMVVGPAHGGEISAATVVEARPVEAVDIDDRTSIYLPFQFDNQRRWNEGDRRGRVALAVAIDGERHRLEMSIEQRAQGWTERFDRPVRSKHLSAGQGPAQYRGPDGGGHIRHAPDAEGGYAISLEEPQGWGCPEVDDE